jgi:hypothetical protein
MKFEIADYAQSGDSPDKLFVLKAHKMYAHTMQVAAAALSLLYNHFLFTTYDAHQLNSSRDNI